MWACSLLFSVFECTRVTERHRKNGRLSDHAPCVAAPRLVSVRSAAMSTVTMSTAHGYSHGRCILRCGEVVFHWCLRAGLEDVQERPRLDRHCQHQEDQCQGAIG
jgi:hypothetical protein